MNPDNKEQMAIVYLYPKKCKWKQMMAVVYNEDVDNKVDELKENYCKILYVMSYDEYIFNEESCKRG